MVSHLSNQKINIDLLPLAIAVLAEFEIIDYNQLFANLFPINNTLYRGKSIKEINLFLQNLNFEKFLESIQLSSTVNDFELELWNKTKVFATTSFFKEGYSTYTILSLSKVVISADNISQFFVGNKFYFKQLLDSIESIIFVQDKDGVIQFCNLGLEKLLNKSCNEIMGKTIQEISLPNADLSFLAFYNYELIKEEINVMHYHHKFVDQEGKEHYLEISKALFNFNNTNYILTTAFDSTQLDFLRQLYEESSALYKALIENAFDAIYLMKGRHYVYVNPRFCELTGYTFDELTDESFDFNVLIPEESKKFLEERYLARLAGKEIPNTYELQLVNKAGGRVYVEVSTVSVGKPGEVVVMGIMRDITQRIQYQQKLLEQQKLLQELNTAKDKFFNIIAHDLRAPISGLISFTQTLIQNAELLSPEESKELLQSLLDCSIQSMNLLENLLQWSRSQIGTMPYNPEPIDLYEIVEAAKVINEPYARQKLVEIVNELHPESYAILDRNMISTVIRNLVSNSIKFTESNGKIVVSLNDLNNEWEILVSDTGVGMTEEQVSSLFKLGETKTTPGTRNEKGSGIGLLLVKEFVEKNQGTISVESKKGQGTTFRIRLPKTIIQS
ncbi:MAG: PAS domain-containing sensor histidine kinase [Candidatus Kapaibacteriales bacterium]